MKQVIQHTKVDFFFHVYCENGDLVKCAYHSIRHYLISILMAVYII